MNWYQQKAREREQTRRLKASGYQIPDERPLSFTSGRGRAFGRRPVSIPTKPQPGPKSESPEGAEKRD